jgi:hypothetical protein
MPGQTWYPWQPGRPTKVGRPPCRAAARRPGWCAEPAALTACRSRSPTTRAWQHLAADPHGGIAAARTRVPRLHQTGPRVRAEEMTWEAAANEAWAMTRIRPTASGSSSESSRTRSRRLAVTGAQHRAEVPAPRLSRRQSQLLMGGSTGPVHSPSVRARRCKASQAGRNCTDYPYHLLI